MDGLVSTLVDGLDNQSVGGSFQHTFSLGHIVFILIFTVRGRDRRGEVGGGGDTGEGRVRNKHLLAFAGVCCVVHCLTEWSRLSLLER